MWPDAALPASSFDSCDGEGRPRDAVGPVLSGDRSRVVRDDREFEYVETIDPATGKALAEVAIADESDVDRAVAPAREVFLASDAAEMITGTALGIDGGHDI